MNLKCLKHLTIITINNSFMRCSLKKIFFVLLLNMLMMTNQTSNQTIFNTHFQYHFKINLWSNICNINNPVTTKPKAHTHKRTKLRTIVHKIHNHFSEIPSTVGAGKNQKLTNKLPARAAKPIQRSKSPLTKFRRGGGK